MKLIVAVLEHEEKGDQELSNGYPKQHEGVEGDKIIIIDRGDPDNKTVKKVLIITPDGKQRKYEIKRTAKGGYLFN